MERTGIGVIRTTFVLVALLALSGCATLR